MAKRRDAGVNNDGRTPAEQAEWERREKARKIGSDEKPLFDTMKDAVKGAMKNVEVAGRDYGAFLESKKGYTVRSNADVRASKGSPNMGIIAKKAALAKKVKKK